MKNTKRYLLWFSKIILSILFLLASLGKLTQNESVVEMFSNWGYFDGFYLIIGALELILALLLLIPKTTLFAAISLFVIMIGALVTHIVHDPILQTIRPLIFMSFLAIIIWIQRQKE